MDIMVTPLNAKRIRYLLASCYFRGSLARVVHETASFIQRTHCCVAYKHEYGHVRNRHVMFITIEHIKNIGISEFENT